MELSMRIMVFVLWPAFIVLACLILAAWMIVFWPALLLPSRKPPMVTSFGDRYRRMESV